MPETGPRENRPQIRRFGHLARAMLNGSLPIRHNRRRPVKLTLKPHILSAIAAFAITACLTFASAAPVVTVASLVGGQIA